jgi:hypothetical protein
MTIAREGGVVRHPAVKSQVRAIGEVEMEAVLSATSNSASIAACHSGDVVFGQPLRYDASSSAERRGRSTDSVDYM